MNYHLNISSRMYRLLKALDEGPKTVRDLIDIIPTNNPPNYIHKARNRFGLEIPCRKVINISDDGECGWYGDYVLTVLDKPRLKRILILAEKKAAQ